ncbi:hypothetical protein [Kitasatospora sp. KL5]|uniref:hypothetical protein n=1 Tax=Kitasatospora sp. KL5 TaxID=3425125 RepID=UPI003D6F5072
MIKTVAVTALAAVALVPAAPAAAAAGRPAPRAAATCADIAQMGLQQAVAALQVGVQDVSALAPVQDLPCLADAGTADDPLAGLLDGPAPDPLPHIAF